MATKKIWMFLVAGAVLGLSMSAQAGVVKYDEAEGDGTFTITDADTKESQTFTEYNLGKTDQHDLAEDTSYLGKLSAANQERIKKYNHLSVRKVGLDFDDAHVGVNDKGEWVAKIGMKANLFYDKKIGNRNGKGINATTILVGMLTLSGTGDNRIKVGFQSFGDTKTENKDLGDVGRFLESAARGIDGVTMPFVNDLVSPYMKSLFATDIANHDMDVVLDPVLEKIHDALLAKGIKAPGSNTELLR